MDNKAQHYLRKLFNNSSDYKFWNLSFKDDLTENNYQNFNKDLEAYK
jgi:hypothetical protein